MENMFFEGTPLTPAVWDGIRGCLPEAGIAMGHSLGGQRAMLFARDNPVERLVLLCTRDRPFPAFEAVARRVRVGASLDETLDRWFRPHELVAGGPVVDYARRCLSEAHRERWAEDLESIARFSFDVSVLQMPVLVVAAEHDQVSTPEVMAAMAARMPQGRFVLWKDGGHMSPFLDPRRLVSLLSDPVQPGA